MKRVPGECSDFTKAKVRILHKGVHKGAEIRTFLHGQGAVKRFQNCCKNMLQRQKQRSKMVEEVKTMVAPAEGVGEERKRKG